MVSIKMEAAGKTKNFLKFKEVVEKEYDEESGSNSVSAPMTVGLFYFSREVFDGKEPEKITVTVEG